jgi:parvulin-like peptidyl-prolyl isomerase
MLETTPLFTRRSAPIMLGRNPEVLDGLFALSKGELSSLLDIPAGVLIAEISEKQEPYIPEFKDVKAKVVRDYVREQAKELCREKAVAMLEEAREKGLQHVCSAHGCKVQETGFFKRTDSAANGKLPANVAKAALSLYAGKVYPDSVEESGRSFYILAFKQAKQADMSGFDAKRKEISDKLLKEKYQSVFQSWLQHAREEAEIKVSANF